MSNIANHDIKVAFDNAGSAVLVSKTYAHDYQHMEQLATDVRALINGSDTDLWDGNDEDLLAALTEAELDRYERVYRMSEIVALADEENDACGVDTDGDGNGALIHWEGGNSPQRSTGFAEDAFWRSLVG